MAMALTYVGAGRGVGERETSPLGEGKPSPHLGVLTRYDLRRRIDLHTYYVTYIYKFKGLRPPAAGPQRLVG